MRKRLVRLALVGAVTAVYLIHARPAAAVHLFPNFPGDPAGDCGAALAEAPAESAARFLVEGIFFIDEDDGDNAVEIGAGDSVTFQWVKYCHSVTSTEVPEGAGPFTTFGGTPTGPEVIHEQVQLVKPEGSNDSYTLTLTVPGTYRFQCVHHASVGMMGEIVVAAADEDGGGGNGEGGEAGGGGSGGDENGRGGPQVLGVVDPTPATGGGALGPGLALTVLGLLGFRLSRR